MPGDCRRSVASLGYRSQRASWRQRYSCHQIVRRIARYRARYRPGPACTTRRVSGAARTWLAHKENRAVELVCEGEGGVSGSG